MRCPKCHTDDSKVIESRDASDGDTIRRRRECLQCRHRFTTYERVERPNLAVIKKDGSRELFDRDKLTTAINRSVGKFFASEVEIQEIVAHIEDALYGLGETEVAARRIGALVLDELAERNEVAYVRFASVYHDFKTLDEFESILSQRRQKKENA